MSQGADIAERRQQMLGKLAELDLAAAEAAHASYLAAIDTPEEAEKGRTYQRMARSLRQSLALHERFDRSAAREAREAAQEARREAILNPVRAPAQWPAQWDEQSNEPDEAPRRQFPRDIPAARARADDLRRAVHRLIWSEGFEKSEVETEQDYAGELVRWLELRIDEDRCEDAFVETPLDEQVAGICEELGLNPDNVARWRDLPDPDPDEVLEYLKDTDLAAARRSSA